MSTKIVSHIIIGALIFILAGCDRANAPTKTPPQPTTFAAAADKS